MGFSTFSGPLRSGTVRDGLVTSRNTGLVVLAQSATVGFASMTTAPSAVNLFTLPAGAKILNFNVEKTTAISGGSVSAVNLTLGKTGTANAFLTSTAIGLTVARTTQAVIDAQLVTAGCNNIGTTDVTVTGTFTAVTGDPTAGEAVVTVYYVQRLPDGTDFRESGE